MEMDLVGIRNQNEYYTNHYFTSIFKDNAEDTISAWKKREKEDGITLPWHRFRDTSRQYYRVRDRYQYSKNEEQGKPYIQKMADLYLNALGYENRNSVTAEVADGLTVPVFHEETKANGAPLLWAFLCVAQERDEDILQSVIFEKSNDEDVLGVNLPLCNADILAKLFFAGEEAPRFIILIGINQIALIDRNKWNEKRYLQFHLNDIFSRHLESTFMAITVLLHKESLCPQDGACVLDNLDENSHKHSAGVSEALKYALRECIEILGNEVIYDMKNRQGIDLGAHPVNAAELTIECLRYMYRFLFMLFIEARPELGYAPMKSQTYVQGYSLEGVRDVCARVKEASEVVSEGYYINDTISELFHMIYMGYPEKLDDYKKAVEIEKESMHDAFTIEALKAHIFDPEYTKLITNAKLRNHAMLQIVDLMSISRTNGSRERRGRISYSALGINQMGAVYEALLSYRGFIAEEDLYEVKREGDKFSELDVGYFVPERELDNYKIEERVRYEKGELKGQLRKYEKGTFIYRLAGREREKSASYYTPEVLTKCLVKYALKELLKDKTADEILHLTICEPAMGSAAFLNEAINQIAEAYLNKKQEELGETIEFDKRFEELQKVKMFIADRNVYGVDLNPIAVELAEVSLWLNTIYKGAYVPWFGTQIVCGNSLIGARRQVYYTSKLERGKWYEEAPVRVMPGEKRKRTGVASRVYHFLLGDPGMANYTDKVIKGLESDNIKKINEWRKEFTKKYDEDDITTLLRLSEIIDTLWDKTVDLRKKVRAATYEPMSVFGHEETQEGSHTTIREKDEIYHKLFKSEKMNNAGPYARLKAAMDYWCALWFWPIDKADFLPSRQEFFFDMSLILEGGLKAVTVKTLGQMSFVDDSGNVHVDEYGNYQLHMEGSQLGLDLSSQIEGLGEVNLAYLRSDANTISGERLRIANEIAEQQRFQHWELEFANVFADKGGFDLVIGNPPWIKIEWNEFGVLSDRNPLFAVKKLSATQIIERREMALSDVITRCLYFGEYESTSGEQNFLNAQENYSLLKGQQTNLYKCFLPLAWEVSNASAVSAFVHPDGIYDDPKGGKLREKLYRRLRNHFMFANERRLFAEVDHHTTFSLNIYGCERDVCFDTISNLYAVETIEECIHGNGRGDVPLIKDENGTWNTKGHPQRIIHVTQNELDVFAKVFDGGTNGLQAKLPVLHTTSFIEVLTCIARVPQTLIDRKDDFYTTEMWHETNAQKDGTMRRNVHFPNRALEIIYSGPHFWVANPLFKTSRRVCELNSDYDPIDLTEIDSTYRPRYNYEPACDDVEYISRMPETEWGQKNADNYRIIMRNMLGQGGERTLVSAIAPPNSGHVHAVYEIGFKKWRDTVYFAGLMSSLPYDFYIKTTGKSSGGISLVGALPFPRTKFADRIIYLTLRLNCLSDLYKDLWETCWDDSFRTFEWMKKDDRLSNAMTSNLSKKWEWSSPLRTDYERRYALIEMDVLVAMALGMTLEQLISIYKVQFYIMKSYEDDTWFDANGRIVFSNKNMGNLTFKRPEWTSYVQTLKPGESVSREIIDDNSVKGEYSRKIEYLAPFTVCNREEDYRTVWEAYSKYKELH